LDRTGNEYAEREFGTIRDVSKFPPPSSYCGRHLRWDYSQATGGKFANGAVSAALAVIVAQSARLALTQEGRPLTEGERHLAKMFFGNEVNPNSVRVVGDVWNNFQDPERPMAPNGNMYMGSEYCDDYSAPSCGQTPTFIHELTHVWQYQSGREVLLRGAYLQTRDYFGGDVYTNRSGLPFNQQNLEQQGETMKWRYLLFENTPSPLVQGLPP
jgi:hypothetical protein